MMHEDRYRNIATGNVAYVVVSRNYGGLPGKLSYAITRSVHDERWCLFVTGIIDNEDDFHYEVDITDDLSLTDEILVLLDEEKRGLVVEKPGCMSPAEFTQAIVDLSKLPDKFWNDVEEVYK